MHPPEQCAKQKECAKQKGIKPKQKEGAKSQNNGSMSLVLFRAAQRGHLEVVEQELAQYRKTGRYDPKYIYRAHRVALRNCWVSVALHLWPLRDCSSWLDRVNYLPIAARSGNAQLILYASEPTFRTEALNTVCDHGHKYAAQCLVTKYANGRTYSASVGTDTQDSTYSATVSALVSAIVSPQNTEFGPMCYAVSGGHPRLVLWLIQARASLDAPSECTKSMSTFEPRSPLEFALSTRDNSRRHRLVVRLLERALKIRNSRRRKSASGTLANQIALGGQTCTWL
jgi:hypothetical protein